MLSGSPLMRCNPTVWRVKLSGDSTYILSAVMYSRVSMELVYMLFTMLMSSALSDKGLTLSLR